MSAFGPAADRSENARQMRERQERAEAARMQHIADQGDALLGDLIARAKRDMEAVATGRPVADFGDDIESLFISLELEVIGRALMRAAFELATIPDRTIRHEEEN